MMGTSKRLCVFLDALDALQKRHAHVMTKIQSPQKGKTWVQVANDLAKEQGIKDEDPEIITEATAEISKASATLETCKPIEKELSGLSLAKSKAPTFIASITSILEAHEALITSADALKDVSNRMQDVRVRYPGYLMCTACFRATSN